MAALSMCDRLAVLCDRGWGSDVIMSWERDDELTGRNTRYTRERLTTSAFGIEKPIHDRHFSAHDGNVVVAPVVALRAAGVRVEVSVVGRLAVVAVDAAETDHAAVIAVAARYRPPRSTCSAGSSTACPTA
jgi:hypothetical protein